MISHDDYIFLLTEVEKLAMAQESDRALIEVLEGNVRFLKDEMRDEYVREEEYKSALGVIREQQGHVGKQLAQVLGLSPGEVLNEDLIGKRMTEIEITQRRIDQLLDDNLELMKRVLMEVKNGPNPFQPNEPKASEKLAAKLQALRAGGQKT